MTTVTEETKARVLALAKDGRATLLPMFQRDGVDAYLIPTAELGYGCPCTDHIVGTDGYVQGRHILGPMACRVESTQTVDAILTHAEKGGK